MLYNGNHGTKVSKASVCEAKTFFWPPVEQKGPYSPLVEVLCLQSCVHSFFFFFLAEIFKEKFGHIFINWTLVSRSW